MVDINKLSYIIYKAVKIIQTREGNYMIEDNNTGTFNKKSTKWRHIFAKGILIIVLVPTLVAMIRFVAYSFFPHPDEFIYTFVEGVLFTHLVLVTYERFVEHKADYSDREIRKLKYEVEEIKIALEEEGIKDVSELEVNASVQKDIEETIEQAQQAIFQEEKGSK